MSRRRRRARRRVPTRWLVMAAVALAGVIVVARLMTREDSSWERQPSSASGTDAWSDACAAALLSPKQALADAGAMRSSKGSTSKRSLSSLRCVMADTP